MARVTVEDCIDKVTNRFELILLASHRSRQISAGGRISVERDNDKNPVVALREIADEQLSPEDLKEDLIHSLQKHVEVDEPEDSEFDDPQLTENNTAETKEDDDNKDNEETNESKAAFDTLSQEEMLARLQELKPPEKADNF